MQNSLPLPKYIGAAFLPTTADHTVISGTPYTLLLADYSSIQDGVRNLSYVPELTSYTDGQNVQDLSIPATPTMFNATLPSIRAVVCTRDFKPNLGQRYVHEGQWRSHQRSDERPSLVCLGIRCAVNQQPNSIQSPNAGLDVPILSRRRRFVKHRE